MVLSLTSLADPPNAPDDAVAFVFFVIPVTACRRISAAVTVLAVIWALVVLVSFVSIFVRPPDAKAAPLKPVAVPLILCVSCAITETFADAFTVLFVRAASVVTFSVRFKLWAVPAAKSPPATPFAVPVRLPV